MDLMLKSGGLRYVAPIRKQHCLELMIGLQVINNTFRPLVKKDEELPKDLVPKLLHRFWSSEGYTLFPDVQPLLQTLRDHYKTTGGRLVVGVISNSDPRVPDVLSSLGMRVSPLRYTPDKQYPGFNPSESHDVDFTVMSYDVGHEKPDRRMFEAADDMLDVFLRAHGEPKVNPEEWRKVYVGDEHEKDVVGATSAGWNAVLIDRETAGTMDATAPGTFGSLFETSMSVSFSSLAKLAAWLPTPKL